jgi:hypothetical protein
MLLLAHRSFPGTLVPRAASGWCCVERCSPWPAPSSPQAPTKIALLWSESDGVFGNHNPSGCALETLLVLLCFFLRRSGQNYLRNRCARRRVEYGTVRLFLWIEPKYLASITKQA